MTTFSNFLLKILFTMKKYIFNLIVSLAIHNICYAQDFKIDTLIFKTKHPIVSATFLDGYFYCLNNEREIFKINDNNEYIQIPNSGIWFEEIQNKKGKLIGLESLFKPHKYYTFTEYHFNGKRFKKRGRINENNKILHDDEHFEISASCSGEWGGTAYFRDKSTNKKYECSATCPITVNKIGNSYLITATLGHLIGFTEILRIDNPTELEPFKTRNKKETGNYESKSNKGVVQLIDTIGVLAITSFMHKNELYHIVTKDYDFSGGGTPVTNIAKIVNGKFKTVTKLWDKHLWSSYSSIIPYKNGWIIPVKDDESNEAMLVGYDQGTIYIIKFERN